MRYLVYNEPNENGIAEVIRSEDEAVKWMQDYAWNQHGYIYETKNSAIDDYIALHLAHWKETL